MSRNRIPIKRFVLIDRGRVRGSWTGAAEHTRCRCCNRVNLCSPSAPLGSGESPFELEVPREPEDGVPKHMLRGAIDVSIKDMRILIRSREFGDRSRRRSYTVTMPVREMAARMPTIVLVEELAKRVELPATHALLDALQSVGHELGEPLAELFCKFTEKVAAMRRANAAKEQ